MLADLRRELAEISDAGRHRRLELAAGIDFTSNDYLGLSRHPAVRQGIGRRLATAEEEALAAPASRLLRGQTRYHRQLEERLAAFKGTEAALLYPSGYQANLGLLTALLRPQDRVLSDQQNHASLIDGVRLARCHKEIYAHLDVAAVERLLSTPHAEGRTFLVTESLYSMDGDLAPLAIYADLAERHGAMLIVDDAHATGLFGDERGSGLCERQQIERRALAIVSTCGKALGVAGAFVAGSQVLIDYLINRSRPFIFTTAPPPLLLFAIDAALDMLAQHPRLRLDAHRRARRLRAALHGAGLDVGDAQGPIVPVVLGDNARALAVADEVRRRGFDVRAIRSPTVAVGSERLRLSVHADHSEADIDGLAAAVIAAVAATRPPSPTLKALDRAHVTGDHRH